MKRVVCPACGETFDLDEDRGCLVCGWYEYEGDEPLDPVDLELLYVDLDKMWSETSPDKL